MKAAQLKNGKVYSVAVGDNSQAVQVSWGVNPNTDKENYIICAGDWVEYRTRLTVALRLAAKMAKELTNS